MARTSQTFQKRLRENKLREKAQLKRERRQQRQMDRKASKSAGGEDIDIQYNPEQSGPQDDNQAETRLGADLPAQDFADPAARERAPQVGGNVAGKLFVGNLPRTATDGALADLVANAGFQVASAVVVRDKLTGDPRGFGFVELAEGEDLQRAIAGLDGQPMDGRPLTVNEARPQRAGSSGQRDSGADRGRGRFDRPRGY